MKINSETGVQALMVKTWKTVLNGCGLFLCLFAWF